MTRPAAAGSRAWRGTVSDALADNVLDKRYDTYGGFGPVSALPFAFVPGGVTDTRTASPAAPVTFYGGARLAF